MSQPDKQLERLRQDIDALDDALLEVLQQRLAKVREIGRYKQGHGLAPLDRERWQAVLESRLARAHSLGLPPDFVGKIYALIHEYALAAESAESVAKPKKRPEKP